jgi:hypothetical protein
MGSGTASGRVYEDAVEYLCRHAEALRELIGSAGWDEHFEVVRSTDPATEAWREAVRALHDAADAAGNPGGIGLGVTMGVGPWPAGPPPRSVGWICPTGRCARVDLSDAEAGVRAPEPHCALAGGPLRQVD